MTARLAMTNERLLVYIGFVVLCVWVGYLVLLALTAAALIPPTLFSARYSYVLTVIPNASVLVMLLLLGLAIRPVSDRAKNLLIAFVLLDLAALVSTVATPFFTLAYDPPLGIFVGVCSGVGALLLLVLAMQARALSPEGATR